MSRAAFVLGVAASIIGACGSGGSNAPKGGGAASGAAGAMTGGTFAAAGVAGSAAFGASGSDALGGSTSAGSGGSSGMPMAGSAGATTGGTASGGAAPSGGAAGAGTAGAMSGAGGGAGGSAGTAGVTNAGAGGASSGAAGTSNSGGAGGGPPVTGCDFESPDGRIVLFDGTSLDAWRNAATDGPCQWKLVGDGTMEVVPVEPPTNVHTVMTFEDLCVHLEYMTPSYPPSVTGQDRGNSGVYLKSAYELQVLDSVGQPADINTCGAVYGISAPLVVACNPELVFNTYEIEFKSSVWQGNTKTDNAVVVSATLNGELVQNDVELDPPGGATQAGEADGPGPKPLMLQDHRNPVRFRNIWVKVPRY